MHQKQTVKEARRAVREARVQSLQESTEAAAAAASAAAHDLEAPLLANGAGHRHAAPPSDKPPGPPSEHGSMQSAATTSAAERSSSLWHKLRSALGSGTLVDRLVCLFSGKGIGTGMALRSDSMLLRRHSQPGEPGLVWQVTGSAWPPRWSERMCCWCSPSSSLPPAPAHTAAALVATPPPPCPASPRRRVFAPQRRQGVLEHAVQQLAQPAARRAAAGRVGGRCRQERSRGLWHGARVALLVAMQLGGRAYSARGVCALVPAACHHPRLWAHAPFLSFLLSARRTFWRSSRWHCFSGR